MSEIIKKLSSKDKILLSALDICFNHGLSGLTFDLLVKKTQLSRGAILYHYKNKEDIYNEMINKYFFSKYSIFYPFDSSNCSTVSEYISKKEENLKRIFEWFGVNGVEANIFWGYLVILVEGNLYYPKFNEKLKTIQNEDYLQWNIIVKKAIEKGEIIPSIDETQEIANLFQSIYNSDIHLLALNDVKKKEDVLLRSTLDFSKIIIKK